MKAKTAVVGAFALLLGACGGDGTQGDALSGGGTPTTANTATTVAGYQPSDNTTTSPTSPGTSGGANTPVAPAKATGLPQTVRYGDMKVTIKSVELSFAEPDAAGAPTAKTGTTAYVFSAFTIENTLQRFSISVTRDEFRLIGPTGQAVAPSRGGIVQVTAASAVDHTVAFPAPAGVTIDKLSMQFGAADRVPMQVPLDGTAAPSSQYPVAVALTSSGPAHSEGSGCRWPLTVQMLRGEIDTSLGFGSGGETVGGSHKDLTGASAGPFSGSARRQAPAGQRVVRATMLITNHGGGLCGGGKTNISDTDFRIVVDGVAREPASFTNTTLDPGATAEFTVAFLYPLRAKQVAITVGSANRALFTQPVALPQLEALPGEKVG